MRICSLLPSATEILYALGLGESLVGVSHECDYPPAATQKPCVSRSRIDQDRWSSEEIDRAVRAALEGRERLYEVDVTALVAARPDLIVTQALCEVCAVGTPYVLDAIQALPHQPRVISLHPHTLSELFEEIRLLGRLTDRTTHAEDLVTSCLHRIERIKTLVAGAVRPRVFCLEWLSPPMAVGHWVPEMVDLAGGTEVLGHAGRSSRYVTGQDIVAASPEAMVLMPCGFSIERTRRELSAVTAQPWWRELEAVRGGRVYLVDGPAYFNRAGPRLVDGIELLAGLFHSDEMKAPHPGASPVARL